MAEYRKQIAYLDYLEDGVKIKNAGFVRIEEQNGHNRMEVKVKNLPGKDCGEFRLQEEHERTVGRISLQGGNGNCCMVWRMPEPGELDNSREESWQQTAQLRILLSGKRMLVANWHEPVEIPAQKETLQLQQQQSQVQGDQSQQMEARSSQTNSPRQPGAGEIIPYPERRGSAIEKQSAMSKKSTATEQSTMAKESAATEQSTLAKEPVATEQSIMAKEPAATEQSTMAKESAATEQSTLAKEPAEIEQSAMSEESAASKQQPATTEAPSASAPMLPFPSAAPKAPSSPSREPVCSTDKWEQLCMMYPEIHPFRDSREYLSIAPKDFVVLCKEYQKLVHNSFLLHGYYNYRHLILGRIRQKDAWQYYIGVPGNFYDREKMVAEMFGFEAFEGEKESASPGDYGYYMKRVEI